MNRDPSQRPPHGRGAAGNADNRYADHQRESVDDSWFPDEPEPLRTELQIDASRTIITRNQSPDIPFDRSINPYRGCEHGCIYCYARPSHAWLGLSPGLAGPSGMDSQVPGCAGDANRALNLCIIASSSTARCFAAT